MGAIGGLLGLSGGAAGTGFAGPSGAPITNPTSAAQLGTAYTGNQSALTSQQALLNAIQAQNGVGNQSQVYNQLQGVVNGTGPNPAQAQLAQATGANIASQAALNAGQRGSSQNVGLIARQNAQQGAATQQNAAGQAATLQANQSLNALGAAGNIAGTQVGNQISATNANTQAQQAEQSALLNANTAFQGQEVGQQSNINTANAALANTAQQGQQGIIGGLGNIGGTALSFLGGSSAAKGGKVTKNSVVPPKNYDGGGDIDPSFNGVDPSAAETIAAGRNAEPLAPPAAAPTAPSGPSSSFGKFLKGVSSNSGTSAFNVADPKNSGAMALQQGVSSLGTGVLKALGVGQGSTQTQQGQSPDDAAVDAANSNQTPIMPYARGGMIKGLVSPGEKYLEPKDVKKVKHGADPMKVGKTIPGKPKVGGAVNSYANDTIPKKLKVGGIIVPRSETMSNNPSKASAKFVEAVLAKRKKK